VDRQNVLRHTVFTQRGLIAIAADVTVVDPELRFCGRARLLTVGDSAPNVIGGRSRGHERYLEASR